MRSVSSRNRLWWLWWLLAVYAGGAIGIWAGSSWRFGWAVVDPWRVVLGNALAAFTPGPNIALLAWVSVSITLYVKRRYATSVIVAFLGSAFVVRAMLAYWGTRG